MDPLKLKEHILESIMNGVEEPDTTMPAAQDVEFMRPQDKKVVVPKALNAPLVTMPPPVETQGPAHPMEAIYEQDAQVRPVDLLHDEAYTPGALAAAKLLLKEEGFTPDAKMDVTRPRIGHGSEQYEDGSFVKPGDTVDKERAYDMLMNRIVRDQGKIDNTSLANIPMMNDPAVEAVTLSRMYHQGPGSVMGTSKNPVPLLFRALMSNNKEKFANAVKKSAPGFEGRLKREAASLADKKK